ncbi:MAG TPA: hypothetical protein ENJ08_00500 [Gammaproteobacteria bacterium]|nr:hypothetical protein [Gammaproteobacteria bacterium]
MSIENTPDDSSLNKAYNRMITRVRDRIESAEANTVPTLQRAIEQARKQAIHLDEMTLEDAEKVGNYIKRDINDAAEYLMETSHEFSDWLMLDIELIEQKVLELFLSVADKTRIELEQLSRPSCNTALQLYRSGEITGPGSLKCIKCKQLVQFNTTSEIPQCKQCGGSEFKRAGK